MSSINIHMMTFSMHCNMLVEDEKEEDIENLNLNEDDS